MVGDRYQCLSRSCTEDKWERSDYIFFKHFIDNNITLLITESNRFLASLQGTQEMALTKLKKLNSGHKHHLNTTILGYYFVDGSTSSTETLLV